MLIGTKRGGTTSLYYDILKEPQVVTLFPSAKYLPKANETKGVHFFDSNYGKGERWYRSFMPTRASRRRAEKIVGKPILVGEASPYYMFHPLAAQRAAAMAPDAKILVLLRDPVMRTYSHWKERRRGSAEPLEFEDALAAEQSRLAGEEQKLRDDPSYYSYAHEQQSYLTQSRYVRHLRAWYELFGAERILVMASEDYYENPDAVLRQVAEFLGIDHATLPKGEHMNAAGGEGISAKTRARLAMELASDTAELELLIGRKLPWH
ncbi:sulfotransferase domain-containing protein [Glaciihabitans sp. INWT7]|uniref:sulfotransferase domain-containing protein n=1 Tax=Glaciihabitans sp. INWT7 TaxID=2596912 RepID=UPI00162AA93B|nr:sulfotransferase domain-containing protein [Glaciihabitans sp. INWT7]